VSQLEKWTQLAERWQDQGPPATPSSDDVDNFSTALLRHLATDAATIGILGCTPSLRTRMRRDWPTSRIVLIDFCREMYLATSAILDETVKAGEEYLCVDWLEMGSHLAHDVDAFIGDKSLDNVEIENWPTFFRSVARCLRPGGLLVLHAGFPDPELAGQSFESLAQPWIDSLVLTDAGIGQAAAGLWEDLLSGSADSTTAHLSLEPYRSALEKYRLSNAPIGILSARVLTDFASQLDARWTRFDESDVAAAASASALQLIDKNYSQDYEAARNQPTLIFKLVT
jgi:SAM-dependent methyltransferase